jgi:dihydrolipoamide dehydrogenase
MTYDLIIIGAGPGGYVCAIRAAQLGKKVAIVEKRGADGGKPRLGGTCLNVGCIPSKALLDTSERFYEAKKHFAEHGIAVTPTIDVAQMLKRKTGVVDTLVGGISGLMRKNKVDVLAGSGELLAPGKIRVTAADGTQAEHTAQHVVLAMGSVPIELPFLPFDGDRIVSSDHAISFPAVPKRLVVVGGGVIGLELGSVWSRLGAEVTVVEALPQICPFLDGDVAKALQKTLEKQGLKFVFEAKVTGAQAQGDGVTLTATAKDGSALSFAADRVLVAVGRRPCSDAAGLAAAGVVLTERKRVKIDGSFRTSLPGVWAIGDLVDGPMLAHKAEEEGVAVAELIAGQHGHVDHNLIPNVVYTEPEVASVGLTEAECQKRGLSVRVGKFPFLANGRARAAGAVDGFVKIIAEAKTDRVLGAAIVGQRAADLIGAIAAHMVYGGSAEDIARTCVAHPTHGEAVKEAALDCLGRVIHT